MFSDLRLLLAVPSDAVQSAARYGLPMAHVAYRVGKGLHLLRAGLPITVRGGLMLVSSGGFSGPGDPEVFCREVLGECSARGFDGLVCDFEGEPVRPLALAVQRLGQLCQRRGWPLYLHEGYARFAPNGIVLIPSALSGGSLAGRLEEAMGRYGRERVALAVEVTREVFPLPAPAGRGTPLSREELRSLATARSPAVFFSRELCAHYFTFVTRESGARFVLFDDGASVRQKLRVAHDLGVGHALLPYPDVSGWMGEILGG